MLSNERQKNKGDNDYSESRAAKNGEGKKKAVFKLECVPFHYTWEVLSMGNIILSQKANYGTVCEEFMYLWREQSSYGDQLSYLYYKGHDTVPKRSPWWINDVGGTLRLRMIENINVIFSTSEQGEQKFGSLSAAEKRR